MSGERIIQAARKAVALTVGRAHRGKLTIAAPGKRRPPDADGLLVRFDPPTPVLPGGAALGVKEIA